MEQFVFNAILSPVKPNIKIKKNHKFVLLISVWFILFGVITIIPGEVMAECSNETVARMILRDLSQDTIDNVCGKQSTATSQTAKDDRKQLAESNTSQTKKVEDGHPNDSFYWRDKEPNGLGFGLIYSGMNGLTFFYDQNLDSSAQIYYNISGESIFGKTEDSLSNDQNTFYIIDRETYSVSYRKFLFDKSFYMGGGAGYYIISH